MTEPVGVKSAGPKGARLGKQGLRAFSRACAETEGAQRASLAYRRCQGRGAHASHGRLKDWVGKAEGGEGRMHERGLSSGFLYSFERVP